MNIMKFRYFVVPNHFIIHNPHESSKWSKSERDYTHIIVQQISKVYSRELKLVFDDRI